MACLPKAWTEIDATDEGSAGVASLVRKGFLKRSSLPVAVEVVPVVEPAVLAPAPASTFRSPGDILIMPADLKDSKSDLKKK